MNKQAPSIGQLITIAGFALSCFGLLLFVWVAFGGPTPLAADGYRLQLPLTQIGQLAEQSDVKISGVGVGRVSDIDLGEGGEADSAIVTLDLQAEYGPVPSDTRAILRAKSLLGEAYIELTPGNKRGEMLEDGGRLPAAQVAKSVQLDEIFRTFDEKTREAFKQGAIDNAIAMSGRGAPMNQALGILPGMFTELDDVLTLLNQEEGDFSRLIRNVGVVFNAISRRQGQLSGMIRNTNTVFQTTAERRDDLTAFFRVFPTFLRESRSTQARLGDFSQFATPVMRKLVPVANELSPTIKASANLAPVSQRFYASLKPIIRKSPRALPQLRAFLGEDVANLLGRIPDYFAEFNPLLAGASYYRRELAAFIANVSVVSNATTFDQAQGTPVSVLRSGVTLGPESLTAFTPTPASSTRTNPYSAADSNLDLASGGLKSFSAADCSSGVNATLAQWSALTPVQQAQFTQNTQFLNAADAESLYDSLFDFTTGSATQTDNVPAPACLQQGPFQPIGDPSQPDTQYQHVFRQP